MEVISVHQTNIIEPCPTLSTFENLGIILPNDNHRATIVERFGKLNNSLTNNAIVSWGDAVGTLAAAVIFRCLFERVLLPPTGFGGDDNPDLVAVIADLAVTGHTNFESFLQATTLHMGTADEVVSIDNLKELILSSLSATSIRLGVTFSVATDHEGVQAALNYVIERVLNVVWALNGPSQIKSTLRPTLGWIAVNSAVDNARRPTNFVGIHWPEADTYFDFSMHGRTNNIRIRYAIAGATDRDFTYSITNLPHTRKPPIVPSDALVIVFLHGHSSGLSEGSTLYDELKIAAETQLLDKPIVMISFDFPSNGYSQYIDPEDLAPIEETTRYVPDHPEERRFGILEVYEKLVVNFVESIHQDLIHDGQDGILNRIAAVIGGSMGGNLALRLSERLVTNPLWLKNVVSWSPAGAYESYGNKDYAVPSPGEEFDLIGKEALERAHQRSSHLETTESRGEFISLQIDGERLIND